MAQNLLKKLNSKNLKKPISAKTVSLERVLNQTEEIKESVKEAAIDLASVNEVLKQEKKITLPVQAIEAALVQNKKAEHQVAKASTDLDQVNIELAKEVAERLVIESELIATNINLAKAHDDLSKSLAKEEETRQIALQDALTGLPNRLLFEQRLNHGLIQTKRYGWGLAIMFIDLDKFKNINDSFGHDVGDKVLLMVAERLQDFVRDEDMVSRWGGDEFVCILLNVHQETDVVCIAEKMVYRIAEPCEFEGKAFSIKASVGIAISPGDGETPDTLFKNADKAMYKAKGTEKRIMLFREAT